MKLTEFKDGYFYKRTSDQKFFKKEGNDYFKVINGIWTKTDELSLSDEFIRVHGNPARETFLFMYEKYKNGNAEEQAKYRDRLLHSIAKYLDEKEGE